MKVSTPSMEDAVAGARRGERDGWEAVYRAFAPRVYRFCRRVLPSREDAEDATQEIFMKLRLKLHQYDPSRSFPAWLQAVAAHHCWDQLRKKRPQQHDPAAEASLESDAPGPDETALAQEERDQVRRALREISDRSRAALVMRYFANLSYREIAEVLEVPESFVGVVLLRARRELRRRLGGAASS
jgi:RNA polymerase sigma-70 factor (ECF subfamily)